MADSSVSTRATVVPMLAYEDAGAAPSSGSSARLVSTSKSTCVVATEVAEQRIAAALAAGGTVVDESNAPSLTVI